MGARAVTKALRATEPRRGDFNLGAGLDNHRKMYAAPPCVAPLSACLASTPVAELASPSEPSLLLMHLRGGLCGDDRVLSEDAVALMQVDRVGEVYDGATWFADQGYGLGWWVNRERSVVSDFGAFGTAVWIDTERGYGAFIAMEADLGKGSAIYEATYPVLDEIFE